MITKTKTPNPFKQMVQLADIQIHPSDVLSDDFRLLDPNLSTCIKGTTITIHEMNDSGVTIIFTDSKNAIGFTSCHETTSLQNTCK